MDGCSMKIRTRMTALWSNASSRARERQGGPVHSDSPRREAQEGEVVRSARGKRLEDGSSCAPGRSGWRPHPVRKIHRQRDQG